MLQIAWKKFTVYIFNNYKIICFIIRPLNWIQWIISSSKDEDIVCTNILG